MTEQSNRRRIDAINDMWREDATFATDLEGLIQAGATNYSLHAKYCDLKAVEQRKLSRKKCEIEKFRFRLMRFYRDGTSDPETLRIAKEQGWEIPPEGKPHIKTDVKLWVDTNDTMIELMLELSEQNDIVELLTEIIMTFKSRSYSISKTIDAVKHRDGS